MLLKIFISYNIINEFILEGYLCLRKFQGLILLFKLYKLKLENILEFNI